MYVPSALFWSLLRHVGVTFSIANILHVSPACFLATEIETGPGMQLCRRTQTGPEHKTASRDLLPIQLRPECSWTGPRCWKEGGSSTLPDASLGEKTPPFFRRL